MWRGAAGGAQAALRATLVSDAVRQTTVIAERIAKEGGTLLAVAKDDRLLAKADLPRPVWNAQYMCQGNDGTLPASYRATS